MSALLLFASCLAGSVLPVFGSEVVVLGAVALAEGPMRAVLIALAAGAQSLGKLLVYGAAAAGTHARRGSAGFGVPALRASMERSRVRATVMVFGSALASLPPLYATAVVCGAARFGRLPFAIVVFVARVVRYAALVWIADPGRIGMT